MAIDSETVAILCAMVEDQKRGVRESTQEDENTQEETGSLFDRRED